MSKSSSYTFFAFTLLLFSGSHCFAQTEIVAPLVLDVEAGVQTSGSVSELAVSDNADVSISRNVAAVQPVVEFELNAVSPFENLEAMVFQFESSVFSRANVSQTVSLFNFESGEFEEIDNRFASRFSDATVAVTLTGDPTRFVESTSMTLHAKVRFQAVSARTRFSVNADFASWVLTAKQITPLFDANSILEPDTTELTDEALITRIGDRVRDRHAREGQFRAYDHYLSFYWEQRTVEIEIVDRVAQGGSDITINTKSLTPLGTRDFRAFFRGLNTVAEYHHNAGMTQIGPNEYTTTITFNNKEGRNVRMGDRMEFEFSPFLQAPNNGRTNYYGTAMLYIVGEGLVPWQGVGPLLDSFPIPQSGLLGGGTTLHYQYSDEPDNLFKQMAGNMAPINAQPFVLGRRLHHTDFGNGVHSEQPNPIFSDQAGKLGPRFIARSCVECHVNNGRALTPAMGAPMLKSVVKVGVDPVGTPHPVLGSVLQPQMVGGAPEAEATIASYQLTPGSYGDGTTFTLRRPVYSFQGVTPSHFSVRLAPPLVGQGLLEAIDESTIVALSDPNDDDGDGISGRVQTVTDPETGQLRLGRFNAKAGQARLRHQVAAALNGDMGVASSVFPVLDGDTKPGSVEVSDSELDEMTRYVALLGVGARRDLANAMALEGEQLFGSMGCANCHTPTMTTGPFHLHAELRNQTIHPYTDLLLHDMGPGLSDNMGENAASGSEWRTAPLWNLGHTSSVSGGEAYLHDGRARSLEEAILWHGGEAESAKEAFRLAPGSNRAAIIKFLNSL